MILESNKQALMKSDKARNRIIRGTNMFKYLGFVLKKKNDGLEEDVKMWSMGV